MLLHSLNYGAAGVDTISGAWYLTGRCQSAKCDRWLTWSVRVKFSPDLSSGRGESHPPAPEVGIMNGVWLFWSDVGGRVLMRPVPRTGRAAWH